MTDWHLNTFNEHRPLLFGIAWRMLGNRADAEDFLQEAFIRFERIPCDEIRAPRAYLVTMLTRLCLNYLDLARVKRETAVDSLSILDALPATSPNPANDTDLAEALEAAFSVVLRCLSPVERAVFLLREAFGCEYDEIARIVEKSEENCRQILRRARERVAGRDRRFEVSLDEEENLMREFLDASASGDFERLAKSLASEVTLVRDSANLGAEPPLILRGVAAVAEFLGARAQEFQAAGVELRRIWLQKTPGLLALRDGHPFAALLMRMRGDRVQNVYVIRCPARLGFLAANQPAASQ